MGLGVGDSRCGLKGWGSIPLGTEVRETPWWGMKGWGRGLRYWGPSGWGWGVGVGSEVLGTLRLGMRCWVPLVEVRVWGYG